MENLDAESIATLVKGGVATLSVALGSKPAALLIEKISSALGWYAEPQRIIRNAKAEAAASVIKAEAENEIKSVNERAAQRILNEEVKYQKNMEAIALGAIDSVKEDAKPNDIDDDWLDGFFNRARHISGEDMQKLWSHILSDEANNPGSFSLRTLNLLSTLTKDDALAFKKICSYAWIDEHGMVTSIFVSNMLSSDSGYNLDLDTGDIFHLDEIGLIIYEAATELTVGGINPTYSYHGHKFALFQKINKGELSAKITRCPVGPIRLTQEGRELYSICDPKPNMNYMNDIINHWKSQGYTAVLEEI